MKRSGVPLMLVALVAISTALPAEAGGRRHYKSNNGNANGWAAAAIGAVVGVAIGSAIANNQSSNYYNNQPNYATQPGYQYYAPQRACLTTQIPVFDQYGRIVQYRQVCAN